MPLYIGGRELTEIADDLQLGDRLVAEIYLGNALVWQKGGFTFIATPSSFEFESGASTGHQVTFIYPAVDLVERDSITLPDWVEFVSLDSIGTQDVVRTILTFNVNANVNPEQRNDRIITTFSMGQNIPVTLTQPGAPQITGAQFVPDGEALTELDMLAENVTVGAVADNVDLVVFGGEGAQFRLGPVVYETPGTSPGGVRVPGVTFEQFTLNGEPGGTGDVFSLTQGNFNTQFNNIERDDTTPAIGVSAVGGALDRNFYASTDGGVNVAFAGTVLAATSGNNAQDRIRIGRGGNTDADAISFRAAISPGAELWLADVGDLGTATSFASTVPLTLDAGGIINDSTVYVIPNNGRTTVGIGTATGADIEGVSTSVNPINAVSNQVNFDVVNAVNRTAELQGQMASLVASPLPGNSFALSITASGFVPDTDILFELYSDALRTTLLDSQTLQVATWNPFVAIDSGVQGASASTIFYGKITQGDEVFPEADGETLQVTVNSRQLRFNLSTDNPDFWNQQVYSTLATAATGSAEIGDAPTGWSINNFAWVRTSGQASLFGTPTAVGTTGVTSQITRNEVNFRTSRTDPTGFTLVYTFPETSFPGLTQDRITYSQQSSSTPARPRFPMSQITADSTSVLDSDYNAMATIRVVSDSGDQLATASTSADAQYPTVDPGSTPLWIEDDEQVPTNAVLTADTTNALREIFNTSTDSAAITALETATPGVFDSNGSRTLLPYVGAYTMVVSTHDADDTEVDGGAPIGDNIGRNITAGTRTASLMIVCNERV